MIQSAAREPQKCVETAVPASPPDKKISLSLLTPWDQQCGNAVYAKRLAGALKGFADIQPFDMRNFMEDAEMRSARNRQAYFKELIGRVNRTPCDLVHIQHEYCFYGNSIKDSIFAFERFVSEIKAPKVVTLHTWLERSVPRDKNRIWRFFQKQRMRNLDQSLFRSLDKCDAVVVHSDDTFAQLVLKYPNLRKKTKVIPIPIAPIEAESVEPLYQKETGDVWILQPGFVCPYKGHRKSIHALQHLPRHFKLVIAGGRHPKDRTAGNYWMELLREIEQKKLESRVLFTGFLPSDEQQAAILKQADVFLLPYDEVGQSGSAVLADALSYNRPVITSQARSMYVYRMSQDTLFSSASINVDDSEGLARIIRESISDDDSARIARKHRLAALKRFSLQAIGEAYHNIYDQCRSNV